MAYNDSIMTREIKKGNRIKITTLIVAIILSIILFIVGIFVGSSHMGFVECFKALFKMSTPAYNNIVWNIRMPRVIAAFVAGGGLAISGLIMQTSLRNDMASPATLGVSNAAVFGANVSIIALSGGFLITGNNVNNLTNAINPFATSVMAFIFSLLSIIIVLGLCKFRKFSPSTIALAGIAIGYIWNAATTILQFYATDVGLSAAVIWSFGDLGRATYKTDLLMFIIVILGLIFFMLMSWRYNTLLSGEDSAKAMGINVELLRFLSLLVASIITAVCVSMLGMIGFVGLICPQVIKRIIGNDHRYFIPTTFFSGSILLLFADILSRTIGNGSALPVGAITSLLGAPFFLLLIFSWRKKDA